MGVGAIPTIGSLGTGLFQGVTEIFSEGLNQVRNFAAGTALADLGVEEEQRFRDQVLPQIRRSGEQLQAGFDEAQNQQNIAGHQLMTGAQAAMGQFDPLLKRVEETTADILGRIPAFVNAAEDERALIETEFRAMLDSNEGRLLEIKSLGDQAVSEFTTKTSDVAGLINAGIAKKSNRAIADFISNAKRLGMSQLDIQNEVRRMGENTTTQQSQVWTDASNQINAQRLNMRATTQTNFTNFARTASAAVAQGLGTLQRAGEVLVGARAKGIGFAQVAQNFLVGTIAGVTSAKANIAFRTGQGLAAINQAKADLAANTGMALAQYEQLYAGALDNANNIFFNGIKSGLAVAVNRPFIPPNFAALMQPGFNLLQSNINSGRQSSSGGSGGNLGSSIGTIGGGIIGGIFGGPGGAAAGSQVGGTIGGLFDSGSSQANVPTKGATLPPQ